MGLARAIAKSGRGTRAKATEIVRSGRVKVNGRLTTDPTECVGPESEILVDEKPLFRVASRYFALHKPIKVICTPADRGGRRLITEFYPPDVTGLSVAGRLDAQTSGLVLLSNDRIWNDLAASSNRLDCRYRVKVQGRMSDLEIGLISAGMNLASLGHIRPREVTVIETHENQTLLDLVIREGKNRQVRGIFNTLRHDVLFVRRTGIGPVRLGNLPPGRFRPLNRDEVDGIMKAAS
jgi:23S rRNA pseudouridine2605 synthase